MVDEQPGDGPFDDDWALRGVPESALRRRHAPPPPPRPDAPRNQLGSPAGPRDWTPAPARAAAGRRTGSRLRGPRRALSVLAVVAVVGAFAISLVKDHGTSGGTSPIAAVTTISGQPVISGTATPGPPSPSGSETAVTNLDATTGVGACFDLPSDGTLIKATFRSCTARHEYELVALEQATGTDDRYPPPSYWEGPVQARCARDLVAYTGQPRQNWPPALDASFLQPLHSSWRAGDRNVFCVGALEPAGTSSLRHLAPYRSSPAIGASESAPAETITGTLIVVSAGSHVCLGLTVANGTAVTIDPADRTYSWTATVDSHGAADYQRSGIVDGPHPDVARIVFHAGARATLTGRYSSPDILGCGGSQEFDFTAAR